MRRVVTGEELAQLYNPDPFAMPRWRAPVYRTPFGIILIAKFARLLGWIARLIARHPLAASILALAAVTWVKLGWVTLVALVLAVIVMLIAWRWCWPVSFSRWVGRPARGKWRAWCYGRRWAAVMTIAGVAPWYQGRTLLPCSARSPRPGMSTGSTSGWSPASPRPTSPLMRITWRTGSARCCAGSARRGPGRWCWSSSAGMPWRPSSLPSPCPITPI
jgi:hypothetical protein